MTRLILRYKYINKRTFHSKSYKPIEITRTNSNENLSSNVRQKFLDYFIKENNHKYVRSSPVVPFCDPTVAFVNAGMNQFKSIFLGHQNSVYKRVANTQKCIRVGGKHNDVNIVGADGYHHTFFEMLGNWSFDDYFKKEACELAWNLLTGPYGINSNSLYVTYFAGDNKLKLEPDYECREIWRSLGIADNHILPFNSENFWEMGPTGPCGPCTEIHVDHTGSTNRQKDVNKNLPDLTELWNIVFIQYNRNSDGSIDLLPKHHIDTGMGLERLTALLQGKKSNYETDLFTDLFDCIQKNCKNFPIYQDKYGIDDSNRFNTAYRILADHSRMITACLADGMIPEENQKLRRLLRKVLLISETVFKQDKHLLNELTKVVSNNFAEVFPEMLKNSKQIQQIIEYEEDIYKSIRSTAMKEWQKILEKEPKLRDLNILEVPGLVSAYNELSSNYQSISPQLAFKLYDTYGLDERTIKILAETLNLSFNSNDLKSELEFAKNRTKLELHSSNTLQNISKCLTDKNIPKTDDNFKYNYRMIDKKYKFDDTDCKVLSIIKNGEIIEEINKNEECFVVLNRTNLYSEAGGQISDKGCIEFPGKVFQILEVQSVNNYIFHKGVLKSNSLKIGEIGKIIIDKSKRLKCMRNHTTTHLINASLKQIFTTATCQKSSKVTPDYLIFDVGIYGKKLSVDDAENIEKLIRSIIKKSVDVKTKEINSQELLSLNDVTLVPGEVYPEVGIKLVEISTNGFLSREPCCGTHVLNTADIKDICITNLKYLGRSTLSLTAVTGDRAILAHRNGQEVLNELKMQDPSKITDVFVSDLKQKLTYNTKNDFILPVHVKSKCLKILNDFNKQLKNVERDSLRQFVDLEMASVLESNKNKSDSDKPYIVHFLGCSSILDSVPLQRATKICSNVPVIVIAYSDEIVKARCCVPENLLTSKFSAEDWMNNSLVKIFNSTCSAPKGQNPKLVCNMKAKRINKLDWESTLEEAMEAAKEFADMYL